MDYKDKYIGQVFDDRYEIQALIGEGGMSIVYRANDMRLNRSVAVKVMREEMAADEDFAAPSVPRPTPSPCSQTRISWRSMTSATAMKSNT